MVYILTEQLYNESTGDHAFIRYREYIASLGDRIPNGARTLVTSDWYFDSSDHRAPHDAWLESAIIAEAPVEDGRRYVSIRLRLFGAYHDGHIELTYRDVQRYRIQLLPAGPDSRHGHRDWRHDEFRVTGENRLEHEIEWWGSRETGTWLIEAADVDYRWIALEGSRSPQRAV